MRVISFLFTRERFLKKYIKYYNKKPLPLEIYPYREDPHFGAKVFKVSYKTFKRWLDDYAISIRQKAGRKKMKLPPKIDDNGVIV